MENDNKGIQEFIALLKRNKKEMLRVALGVFSLVTLIALLLPSTYKSTGTILIEQQEIPQDLVESTVTSYASERIQLISQRIMASNNLKQIIEKFDLYHEGRKSKGDSFFMGEMRDAIELEMVSAEVIDPERGRPTEATIAFLISYENESPKIAQQVANELVTLYLDENIRRRTKAAEDASKFLEMQAKKLRESISQLEMKLEDFKKRNAGNLPENQALNMQLMDRTGQQMFEIDKQVSVLTERQLYLSAELAQVNPRLDIYSTTGERIYGSGDRLKILQAEYISLLARYSETHPNIIKIRKEIAALEREVGGVDKSELRVQLNQKRALLATLTDRYSAGHPDVKKLKLEIGILERELSQPVKSRKTSASRPDNPAYIQLQTQLHTVNASLRSLQQSRDKLSNKLVKYEQSLLRTPGVEREYLELTRDYDTAKNKYNEIKNKQMKADMAEAMEQGSKGERFTLIEPPMLPLSPYKPNRFAIILLGAVLSIGIALAYASIKENMFPVVYNSRELAAITGEAPLVVIPYIETEEDIEEQQRKLKNTIYWAAGGLVLLMTYIHFFKKPLNVIGFILLQKLGIY